MVRPDPNPSSNGRGGGWNLGAADMERVLKEAARFKGESLWQDAWRRLRRNRPSLFALIFLALFAFTSLLAPLLPLPAPTSYDPEHQLESPAFSAPGNRTWRHRSTVVFVGEPGHDDELLSTVESVSGRRGDFERQPVPTGTQYSISVPMEVDDSPRVDYVDVSPDGVLGGWRHVTVDAEVVRAWTQPPNEVAHWACFVSYDLDLDFHTIRNWRAAIQRSRVQLFVEVDGLADGLKGYRYEFRLAEGDRSRIVGLRLGDRVLPVEGKRDSRDASPATATHDDTNAVAAKVGGIVTIAGNDYPLAGTDTALRSLVSTSTEGVRPLFQTFKTKATKALGHIHADLAQRIQAELKTHATLAKEIEYRETSINDGYPWQLSTIDRTMLSWRAKLFGFWCTGPWCGTDDKGRDLLSRIIWGSRTSILVALAAALCSLLIGVTYGALSGYLGGRIDNVMMRIVDILYAIPFIFVVIFFITVINANRTVLEDEWGLTREHVFYVVIGAIYWLTMARVVRGQVLSLRHTEFVEAARVVGASTKRILFFHLVPNVLSIVIVYLTLTIPAVMLFESFLSFLGLGIEPPKVSWGLLAADGTNAISQLRNLWWLIVFPALAMGSTLLALNILGDGLRDALDPKLRGKD